MISLNSQNLENEDLIQISAQEKKTFEVFFWPEPVNDTTLLWELIVVRPLACLSVDPLERLYS